MSANGWSGSNEFQTVFITKQGSNYWHDFEYYLSHSHETDFLFTSYCLLKFFCHSGAVNWRTHTTFNQQENRNKTENKINHDLTYFKTTSTDGESKPNIEWPHPDQCPSLTYVCCATLRAPKLALQNWHQVDTWGWPHLLDIDCYTSPSLVATDWHWDMKHG